VNALITAHHGTGRYVMIAYMKNFLLARVENLLDWIADSLIDFSLEFDDELFDDYDVEESRGVRHDYANKKYLHIGKTL